MKRLAQSAPRTAEVRVAERLKALRAEKRLTLRALAMQASISEAYLSRVENHKAAITIAGLERLAQVLGVSLGAFFETEVATQPIMICRAGGGRKALLRGRHGFVGEMLAAAKTGKLMEPLVVDITSGKRLMPLKSHGGEEFDYLLDGECRFVYGKEVIHLYRGDAVYYDATVPHAAHPVKGKPGRMLVVVASRDYLFHGDLSRLLNGGDQ